MIVWLIILGIIAIGAGIVVATGMSESRMDEKVADTADWLETEATIQDAVIVRIDKYTWWPSFAFSYSVKDEYFSGRFILKANEKQRDEPMKTLLNQKFPVQYDPGNPSAWYIAKETLGGYVIIQKLSPDYPPDFGPYTTDGGESIDLHLNR